jgi:hypothetical protein
MVIRRGGDVKGNTRAGLKERGKINSIQAGRKLAPCMP